MTEMPSSSSVEVDASVWRAVMGSSVDIPPVNTHVYYFPEGHLERIQIQSSSSVTVLNYNFTLSRPFIPCQLLSVRFLSDPSSDKLFVRMVLRPTRPRPLYRNHDGAKNKIANDDDVVSFSKSLTQSDANTGGGFSIPKFCAEMIFPRLQPIAAPGDTPGQDLTATDAVLNHRAWGFRHIYRGTPRRHILSTGWSQYLRSKRLATGDTVVFVKKKSTEELFVGVRRRGRAHRIDNGPRREGGTLETLEAVRRALAGMEFEVVYYPEFGWPDFVVRAEKVEDALKMRWTAGMQVRMAVDGDHFSRLSWFQGVVAAATSLIVFRSPWRMLQVNWDAPDVLHRRVCPWQVEHIPLIEPYFLPPSKKFRAQHAAAALTLEPVSIHRHNPYISLNYNISSSPLFFSSSIQGDRQDNTRELPKKDSDDQQPGSLAVVSTILSIGSSWSDSESVHDKRLDNRELPKKDNDDRQPGSSVVVSSTILSIGSSWSESNSVHDNRLDNRELPKKDDKPGYSAVVSTILSIGSSWSESEGMQARGTDNLLGDQQGNISSGGCLSTFRLFGKMIEMSEPFVGGDGTKHI